MKKSQKAHLPAFGNIIMLHYTRIKAQGLAAKTFFCLKQSSQSSIFCVKIALFCNLYIAILYKCAFFRIFFAHLFARVKKKQYLCIVKIKV